MADFRYTLPSGEEVEAFQMTPATRYQEKHWPEWMNSRYLLTIDKGGRTEEWLKVNDVETKIPQLGWVMLDSTGSIKAVDYTVMEAAVKVVEEERVVAPAADVDITDEQALRMADQPDPSFIPPPPDNSLLFECRQIYQLLVDGKQEEGVGALRHSLAGRASWCDCPPGGCDGQSDMWDCRKNSPLVQS